ncbi:hypothetical protein MKX03_002224 [Papaver bracteatum]|nr:hypothetical protein MKX03_002224 [Papaver bracteatum]
MMSGNICQSSTGEHEVVEGRRRETDSYSESNHEYHIVDNYGNTPRLPGNHKQIIFDKYGRPCDIGSEQFVMEIGKIVQVHCRSTIDSWTVVSESIKYNIRNNLRLVLDKYDTIVEMKRNMHERLIAKREDWESFNRRSAGKKAREFVELLQSCGRKGISGIIYDLENMSPTGEINRCVVFAITHVTKTINDPTSTSASDVKIRKIKELVDADPKGQNDVDNDVIAKTCGRDQKGNVQGMGGGVTKTQMRSLASSRETLRKVQQESKSMRSDIDLLQTQVGTLVQRCISSSSSSNQAPDKSYLPAASKCFIKNFKGRTISLGIYNTGASLVENVYSVILEEIFDRDAELYDKDGTLGDIMLGEVINWLKASVKPYQE